MLQVQVNAVRNAADDQFVPLPEEIESRVRESLARFENELTRIEIHFSDENGPKQGVDKRCSIEARLAGRKPLVVKGVNANIEQAFQVALTKLNTRLSRLRDKSNGHSTETVRALEG